MFQGCFDRLRALGASGRISFQIYLNEDAARRPQWRKWCLFINDQQFPEADSWGELEALVISSLTPMANDNLPPELTCAFSDVAESERPEALVTA